MAEADVDISELTEDQQLALQQFTSVTAQDHNVAVRLLRKCEWNVQIAIARFFDGEPPEPAPDAAFDAPPPRSSRRHETLMNNLSDTRSSSRASSGQLEPAPRIVNQPESQILQQPRFPFSLVLTPISLIWSLFSRTLSLFSYLFPFLPRLLARFTARNTPRRPLAPRDTTARFLRDFEEEYGPHGLPFSDQSYASTFDTAKRTLSFLLVIPLSPDHDDTGAWVRSTLLSTSFQALLAETHPPLLLWAGSVQDSEAFQVTSALSMTKFPAAALLAPLLSPTSSSSVPTMSVVARLLGPLSPDDFTGQLRTAMATHADSLARARATQAEHAASRSLRETQNEAYERSLARDRERAAQRRAEAAAQEREAAERRAREEQRLQRAADLRAWRVWRAAKLLAEPEASAADAVRISLRLASGERVMRRFVGSAGIEEVYAFVECFEVLEGKEKDEVLAQPPAGFVHEYRFRLVSPMPREIYALEDGGSVKERIGRSGNLIVEMIEGMGDDEEGVVDEKQS